MIIEIDRKSGFCFGVTKAIGKAEETLNTEETLYSLGHIVHNELEVKRLQELGLRTIDHEAYFKLSNCKVLIRAHGEPPLTYEYALKNNITLIDATCPVVLMLQQRIRKAAETMKKANGQVVIFGHAGHAEVAGLAGQSEQGVIILDHPDDSSKIDPARPVVVFSQTTRSVADFKKLSQTIQEHSQTGKVETHDTICRQVSNRVPHLEQFAVRFDRIIFVGGRNSSNARVLFEVCRKKNNCTYFVSSPEDVKSEWFEQTDNVGICGATSTPQWLMEKVAERIRQF
jgi:4-hydroxy-3-methylbut-2-enyl diphosphate reductase